MSKKINLILALAVAITFTACKKDATTESPETTQQEVKSDAKIVSLNGAISETIAALGHADQLVGRDVTSTFPTDLTAKDLGHVGRGMTIEGIMSVNPTLIIGTAKEENPDLMTKIKESGIKLELVNQEYSVEGAKNLIKKVAEILGNADVQKLNDKIDADIAQVQPIEKKPKVLFIYARGTHMLNVSGTGTPMDALIKIAGGENAVTGFSDFKTLTPESLIQGNPDIILMFDSGSQSLGGLEGVLKIPGMEQTNAGKNKKIITMDGGLISNFGPRTGEAALELNKKLIEATK
ncbi:heme/hemin ABC transporter substrate-binding protein [Moheibacter sediminis]|nr:ABC transporter substrate-binding protein [Moheibacter sediminis]